MQIVATGGVEGRPFEGVRGSRLIALPAARTGAGVVVRSDGVVAVPRALVADARLVALKIGRDATPRLGAVLEAGGDASIAFLVTGGQTLAVLAPSAETVENVQNAPNSQARSVAIHLTSWQEPNSAASHRPDVLRIDREGRMSIAGNDHAIGGVVTGQDGAFLGMVVSEGPRGAEVVAASRLAGLLGQVHDEDVAHLRARLSTRRNRDVIASLVWRAGTASRQAAFREVREALGDTDSFLPLTDPLERDADADVIALYAALRWNAAQFVMDDDGAAATLAEMPDGARRDRAATLQNAAISGARTALTHDRRLGERSPWIAFAERAYLASEATPPAVAATSEPLSDPDDMDLPPAITGIEDDTGAQAFVEKHPILFPYLTLGVPFSAMPSSIGIGGFWGGAGLHVVPVRIGQPGRGASLGLALGGGSLFGGWENDALFTLMGEVGFVLQLGGPEGFFASVTWSPGLLVARGEASFSATSFRAVVGMAIENVSFGLSWREVGTVRNAPLRAPELFATVGF